MATDYTDGHFPTTMKENNVISSFHYHFFPLNDSVSAASSVVASKSNMEHTPYEGLNPQATIRKRAMKP
jgi:hypothetical protein